VFAGRNLAVPWDGGYLYRCRRCDLGFRHPIRRQEEYEALYEAASDQVWVSATLRPDQLRVRNLMVSAKGSGRVLDVGCYDGALLASLGPQFEKYGIEASSAAAASAQGKGIKIIASRIRDLASTDLHFDIVCAVDVIEHVPDPRVFLELLARRLAPGGLIIVSSGNIDTQGWRFAGGRYWYCRFPEHISFISRAWGDKVASDLGLDLYIADYFAHGELDPSFLSSARRQFFRHVAISNFKVFVISLLPGCTQRVPPRSSYGGPGLFEDHVILAFRKSEPNGLDQVCTR